LILKIRIPFKRVYKKKEKLSDEKIEIKNLCILSIECKILKEITNKKSNGGGGIYVSAPVCDIYSAHVCNPQF
jgi:hypothetical protein